MNKRSKALIEYGKACGFTVDGQDGNEHYTLRHPNGSTVRVASTPGDYRGDRNTEAEMRRKSGVTPPRPRSGSYRKGVAQAAYSPATERIDSLSATVSRLERRHHSLCAQIREAQATGAVSVAAGYVSELLAVEAEFESIGRRPPLRTFRTH